MKICQQRIRRRSGVRYFDIALGDAAGQVTLHVTASSDFASVLTPRVEFLEKHYWKNAACIVKTMQVGGSHARQSCARIKDSGSSEDRCAGF
jgi:hypothetical protein